MIYKRTDDKLVAFQIVSFQIMSYLDGHYILGSEYVTEIFFWVKELERRPGRAYKKISPQLSKRGQLVEWSRDVSCKLGLCESTFHLAVRLIDLFMDGHEIAVSAAACGDKIVLSTLQDPQLYLVALGGLLLAAKMEEKDGNIPKCTKLNSFVKNFFPIRDFYSIELVMLNYFDWNISLPTACYFASTLLPYSILETDRLVSGPILHYSKAQAYLEEYVQLFLKLSVSEISFIELLPSVVGVAVVAASRKAFGLVEAWPFKLQRMTDYSWADLHFVVQRLLFILQQMSASTYDEGYGSCSGSPINSSQVLYSYYHLQDLKKP